MKTIGDSLEIGRRGKVRMRRRSIAKVPNGFMTTTYPLPKLSDPE
jgi:hypothetical protein